jgi:hypothetical protein
MELHDIIAYKLVPLVYEMEFGNKVLIDHFTLEWRNINCEDVYVMNIIYKDDVKYVLQTKHILNNVQYKQKHTYLINDRYNILYSLHGHIYNLYGYYEKRINCKCGKNKGHYFYCNIPECNSYKEEIPDCIKYVEKYMAGRMKRRYTGFHDISIKTE